MINSGRHNPWQWVCVVLLAACFYVGAEADDLADLKQQLEALRTQNEVLRQQAMQQQKEIEMRAVRQSGAHRCFLFDSQQDALRCAGAGESTLREYRQKWAVCHPQRSSRQVSTQGSTRPDAPANPGNHRS